MNMRKKKCIFAPNISFIMGIETGIFKRTELLIGHEAFKHTNEVRVIIFGVGGVGSWCAESLIRSGIRKLTIVDSDRICITNINRQLMATTETVGQVKVEALKKRLLSINPSAEINAIQQIYCADTAESFQIETYDYIIDAIDSLENKALLIRHACTTEATFFSSMGAALKMDSLKIDVAEFWKVKGCPLAAALRRKFKKTKIFPAKKFKCVYSEELLENQGTASQCGTDQCICKEKGNSLADENQKENDWHAAKVHTNGTIAHTTAIFGFTLAGLVIQDILKKTNPD